MTTKLDIKYAVFCRNLTLVAKYVFSQAPSYLEIWLQALGDSTIGFLTIYSPGSDGEDGGPASSRAGLPAEHPL